MTGTIAEGGPPSPLRFSIVILTYARDTVLRTTLDRLHAAIADRPDAEVVLVDNNADDIDRDAFLTRFAHRQWVRMGENRGVSARNEGMAAARGDIVVLLDDDVLIETKDFLDRFAQVLESDPTVGVVNARKLDATTMALRPEYIPHSRKDIDATKPFLTFRFVGGLVALRRKVFEEVGGFSPEFFWGLEEREYSYRIVQAGWKIYYEPGIVALETTDAGGRKSRFEQRTENLANRYIISFIHTPFIPMIGNFILFTVVQVVKERGQIGVFSAFRQFLKWLGTPGRSRRQPIDHRTRAYIHACGGELWK